MLAVAVRQYPFLTTEELTVVILYLAQLLPRVAVKVVVVVQMEPEAMVVRVVVEATDLLKLLEMETLHLQFHHKETMEVRDLLLDKKVLEVVEVLVQ